MSVLRVTREFSFEMAHALDGYTEKCAYIHGHSYHMSVTVAGRPGTRDEDSFEGMVMDFSVLKEIVTREVISLFDHALVVKDTDPRVRMIGGERNVVSLPYQPTCENLLVEFARRIGKHITSPLKLCSIYLRETPHCYASWHAEDNP